MKLTCERWLVRLLGAVLVMIGLAASPAVAADIEMHQLVDGIAVYLGVLPEEMIQGHPKAHPESQMHGGVPSEPRYHLTVAIFDAASSQRISGANLTLKVTGSAGEVVQKALEPMTIGGKRAYGNYFKMPGAGPYRIEVGIHRPEVTDVIRAVFHWGRT